MRPVKPQRRAPVVHHQRDRAGQPHRLEPGIEVSRVIREAVRARGRLAGVAHADQVGGQAMVVALDPGDDVAPEVRGGRVAVQEHHRRARPRRDIGHLGVEDGRATARDRGSAAEIGWLIRSLGSKPYPSLYRTGPPRMPDRPTSSNNGTHGSASSLTRALSVASIAIILKRPFAREETFVRVATTAHFSTEVKVGPLRANVGAAVACGIPRSRAPLTGARSWWRSRR